jgi:hypothetical protein
MTDIKLVEERRVLLRAATETLDPSHQEDRNRIAAILSTPETVAWQFADHYKHGAEAVLELVKPLSSEQQVAVLAARGAVSGLARNGQSVAVLELVKALSPEQQTRVLSAGGAVTALINYSHDSDPPSCTPGAQMAGAVVELVKALKSEQQVIILSDNVGILARRGYGKEVVELVKALSPEQQAAVLNPLNVELLRDAGWTWAVKETPQSFTPQAVQPEATLSPPARVSDHSEIQRWIQRSKSHSLG